MLLIAGSIAHFVTLPRLDFAYAGVFVWGAAAIAKKNINTVLIPEKLDALPFSVISGTAIGLSISLIVLLLSFSFHKERDRSS